MIQVNFKIIVLSQIAGFSLFTSGLLFGADSNNKPIASFKQTVSAVTKQSSIYKTPLGNQIWVYTVQGSKWSPTEQKGPRFLIQGGLHGNELLGSEFVNWLAIRFANGESKLTSINQGNLEIDFLPYANPDGTLKLSRYNGNDVNLNRNFPILWGTTKENPGHSPGSEVETKAIQSLFEKRSYSGAVDVHGYINWIVVPSEPHLVKNPDTGSKQYGRWNQFIRQETTKRLPNYEVKSAGELGDGGAFEDYGWWAQKVPSLCLELFTNQRYIKNTVIGKFLDTLTPNTLRDQIGKNTSSTDLFLVYEDYLYSVLIEASKIKSELDHSSKSPELAIK